MLRARVSMPPPFRAQPVADPALLKYVGHNNQLTADGVRPIAVQPYLYSLPARFTRCLRQNSATKSNDNKRAPYYYNAVSKTR